MANISINLFSLCCYTYILVNVVCAVVRWVHMCPPYNERENYFYPARRQFTFVLAASVLQIPYVVQPSDEGTWVYIRCMAPVFYSLSCSMLFLRYFMRIDLGKDWKTKTGFCLPMLFIIGMLSTLVFGQSSFLEQHARWFYLVACVGSVALFIPYLLASRWLRRRINDYHEQNYSNPSQFPYRLAEKVLYLPVIWMGITATVSITGSRTLKMYIDCLFSLWIICILCLMLKPNRQKRSTSYMNDVLMEESEDGKRKEETVEEELDDTKETKEDNGTDDSVTSKVVQDTEPPGTTSNEMKGAKAVTSSASEEDVRKEVLSIICRRYKEPDLKRTDVINEVGYRRKKLAGAYITSLGFYKLVNAFRLWHFEIYQSEHPHIGTEAAAIHNGFKDRWALHNARKRIADFDYRQIQDFLPEKE